MHDAHLFAASIVGWPHRRGKYDLISAVTAAWGFSRTPISSDVYDVAIDPLVVRFDIEATLGSH
jgi:hypothetical protein